MTGSGKSGSGCLSSVMRHLLCSSGIPTHPSAELDSSAVKKLQERRIPEEAHGKEVGATLSDRPGIVARLMGLETLPADSVWVPKFRKSPKSVPRSRSVSFMDYLLEVDSSHGHRRVRTSVSFREEVPLQMPRHQVGPEDLLVLYLDELENVESKKEVKVKPKRLEPGLGEPKHKDNRRRVSKPRNEPTTVRKEEARRGRKNVKQRGKLIQEKEVIAESKFTKKRREGKSIKRVAVVPVESDGSGASSPISVLYVGDRVDEHVTSIAQAENTLNLSPRRDVSPPSKFLPPARISDPLEQRGRSSKKEMFDSDDYTCAGRSENDYCLSVAVKVYRLTEGDIVKNSSWVIDNLNSKAEDFSRLCEEISALIEHQVLEEVVYGLCT